MAGGGWGGGVGGNHCQDNGQRAFYIHSSKICYIYSIWLNIFRVMAKIIRFHVAAKGLRTWYLQQVVGNNRLVSAS